ncbi:conserved hypothetical protein [Theileria equi strain WA]|uniref:Deoxyhypusine hydroxylase n=1 Tax=Theileria equi strain WA TaxID=1537102 RepID=L1LEX3_THEEQ|nr:conserved hypothetical protein [Theileria equi strain WA]EKX73723.1 conserved hypothetical protein [Theileria equi strain WA]|eukprot:XP_004833175.1 conserved hypothetical protein [Theileria equi strain WA]
MVDTNSFIDDFLRLDEFSKPSKEMIESVLLSKDVQLSAQLRALYFCRDLPIEDATKILLSALEIHHETFLRHEIAYVIGQSGCFNASDALEKLLKDSSEDPMVRHEAAEALGAIGSKNSLELIKKYSTDHCRAVSDTCKLALHSLLTSEQESQSDTAHVSCPVSYSAYRAIDPILSALDCENMTLESLSTILMNEGLPLYKRYEALYAIRNIATGDAAKVIGSAMVNDKSSEVFRHECAFVLGQMQEVSSVNFLVECLKNSQEEPMARHEAALALGSCGSTCTEQEYFQLIMDTLTQHLQDSVKVVSDSCLVALDNISESRKEVLA